MRCMSGDVSKICIILLVSGRIWRSKSNGLDIINDIESANANKVAIKVANLPENVVLGQSEPG